MATFTTEEIGIISQLMPTRRTGQMYNIMLSHIAPKDIDHAMLCAVSCCNIEFVKAIVDANLHDLHYRDPMGGATLFKWIEPTNKRSKQLSHI